MYFDNINLLRAFAALSVLVYHIIELYPWKDFPAEGLLLWFRVGGFGVDLFFLISGFVITLAVSQLYEKHGNQFYGIYLRRRMARIAPLYFLTGFFFILFCQPSIIKSPDFYKNLLYHSLFIHNLDFNTHGTINGPNWSVAVEMQFYILIMVGIPYLVRFRPGLILITCILIGWAWRFLVFIILCHDRTCSAELLFIPSTQLIGCLDEFGFGIYLARVILDKNSLFFRPGSICATSWFWLIIAVIVAWSTFTVCWWWVPHWEFWWMVVFWKTLSGLTFFAVLMVAIKLVSLRKFNKFLLSPFFYLGEISYGIYLWHSLVILSLLRAEITNPVNFLLLTLFFTLSLSAFSWHFVEQPLIRRFR